MAHSLTTAPPTTSTPISTKSNKKLNAPSVCFHRVWACDQHYEQAPDDKLIHRRNVALGLAGAVLGLNVTGDRNANAAARRPPPPQPEEKKDPNVSGVQAKVLASKKRKEAMKQAVAKLREKGKPVNGPSE
ncbi:hypothetical protein CICLE_v10022842mg [Citrus x clementina]|uniref:Uncharacterized protein n=1 Tax=Citrus clementina TaxID=85681 RepID=V4TPT1_CITCL|nr:uncharacterized protein LOC18047680 [Citrus x clementina]ESR55432.1 hypothetical protein CICLE_v10022842mg [Citrus x clementina]